VTARFPLEVWSPLPPQASGVADYVEEQLSTLGREFSLTLVVENPNLISGAIKDRFRVIAAEQSDPNTLRIYHVGNSPLHAFIYREAVRVPGIVVLHEWNLHELLLGFAVNANDFDAYRRMMRREHGERGSVAAETIASALGGRHWPGLFPLNLEILERALAVIALAGSTTSRAAARVPGIPSLHLPHHAVLRSHTTDRGDARRRLGFSAEVPVILAPGLGTSSKSLEIVAASVDAVRREVGRLALVTVGGGAVEGVSGATSLGRVDLETLGDALVAADVVVALRFPSRGEASGVLMRALAAGRAVIVSTGSTADEDLPMGVVSRVSPGPGESAELAAVLRLLLTDDLARLRLERLAAAVAATRGVEALTGELVEFIRRIALERSGIESALRLRATRTASLREPIRNDIEAAAHSLGLAHLPPNVFERLAGL
jgi:glycosyltransferase involved in cell wall biosynthesis